VGFRNEEIIVAVGFLSLCPARRVVGGRESEGEGTKGREKQQTIDRRTYCDNMWHDVVMPHL
jgi:hypothetical protein